LILLLFNIHLGLCQSGRHMLCM